MFGGEKAIDGWLGFKLSHNPGQGRSVVMNLGFLHATLPVFVIEEVEYGVERLLWIVQHIGERPALTVLKKILTGDGDFRHL